MQIPKMMSIEELRRKRKAEGDSSVKERSARLRDEVKSAYKREADYERTQAGRRGSNAVSICLKGVAGIYNDAYFPMDEPITIGRTAGEANILYPADTPGISRLHCRVWIDDDGMVRIKDLGSSQGTFFQDGSKLSPNKVYRLRMGEMFYLASTKEVFRIVKK